MTPIRVSKSVLGENEQVAVVEILKRGYLGMGVEVKGFEEDLGNFLGAPGQVACVSTGTAALHLALQAIGVSAGDEVLVPSFTYLASFQAISATGAVPVSCEVHLSTGLIDLSDAQKRVTARTRALMPVHYASQVSHIDEVYRFSEKSGLRVVEDAAHAFGCRTSAGLVGATGDVVCFSFDGIKNITSGEGGAIVSRDTQVMKRVRDARLLAVENDTEKRYQRDRSWEFDVHEQGWRYHMSEIMAAIGRVQLPRLEKEFAPARKRLAKLYRERLAGFSGIALFNDPGEDVVPHIFPIRVLDGQRDRVRLHLKEAGVETGIHYKPNHLLARYGAGRLSLPVTEQLYREILSLPLHPEVSEGDLDSVVLALKEVLR